MIHSFDILAIYSEGRGAARLPGVRYTVRGDKGGKWVAQTSLTKGFIYFGQFDDDGILLSKTQRRVPPEIDPKHATMEYFLALTEFRFALQRFNEDKQRRENELEKMRRMNPPTYASTTDTYGPSGNVSGEPAMKTEPSMKAEAEPKTETDTQSAADPATRSQTEQHGQQGSSDVVMADPAAVKDQMEKPDVPSTPVKEEPIVKPEPHSGAAIEGESAMKRTWSDDRYKLEDFTGVVIDWIRAKVDPLPPRLESARC